VSDNPRQREDLDVNEADDGLIIYDGATDRVHHLNVSATLVFELCTGENDEDRIVALVDGAFELGGDATAEAETRACLDQLRTEGLIR
jgi:hypothetical protein